MSIGEASYPDLHVFGGAGPVVHLAPANGFPPGTYAPLAEALVDSYRVVSLLPRPLWPDSQPDSAPTWHVLAGDLVSGLESSGHCPCVGIGHSIGGILAMWAAVQRPDLFRAVVLVDPVLVPASRLWSVRAMRLLGLEGWLPLVRGAFRRRRTWPGREACVEYLRGKALFANWPEESLRAYAVAGTRAGRGGCVELVYPPEWEAHIFASTPTDVWRDVPRLRTPALLVRGEHSDTFPPSSLARMVRYLPAVHTVTIPGAGHLAPMEAPAATGAAIHGFLGELGI